MTREERRQQSWEQMPPWQRHFAMTLYRLIEERGGQNKIVTDMARHGLNIRQARLSEYIHGKHIPRLDVVYALADFFGVPVSEFLI